MSTALLRPAFRKLLAVCGILIEAFNAQAQASGATPSRQALDKAMHLLEENGWQAEGLSEQLRQIVTTYPDTKETVTAQLFYGACLNALDDPQNVQEQQAIYEKVIAAVPNSWQGAIARLFLASTYGLGGESQKEVDVARQALVTVDFKQYALSDDPDFRRLQTLYSTSVSDIQDGFRALVADGLIKQGALAAAEQIIGEIANAKMKQSLADVLANQKKNSGQ